MNGLATETLQVKCVASFIASAPYPQRILQQLFKIKRRETPQTLVDTCSVLICTAVKEDVFQSFICQVLTVVEEYRSVSSEIHCEVR